MKPISELFDGLVVLISPGATLKNASIGELIVKHGGLVVENLNSRITYVLTDSSDESPVLDIARTLGVKLVTEKFFIDSANINSLRNETAYLVTATNGKKRPAGAAPTSLAAPAAKKAKKVPGVPPVDKFCQYAHASHIYKDAKGVFWKCMLNQTNMKTANSNKFYLVELIESNSTPHVYSVWTRWGRVGAPGQSDLKACHTNVKSAKDIFEKKFKDKTGNEWSDKDDFEPLNNKYTLIDLNFEAQDDDEEDDEVMAPAPNKPVASRPVAVLDDDDDDGSVPASKLDDRVFDLIEMIFSKKMMANTVAAMNYDVKKNPLGKLHKKTIQKGFSILKEIGDILKSAPGGHSKSPKIMDLTNQFYTYIPHNAGKARLPFIDNTTILKEKVDLLDTLNEIDVANKKSAEAEAVHAGPKMHPVDRQYETLNINIKPVEKNDPMYVLNTKAPTHNDYTYKVLEIFEIERDVETKNFNAKYKSMQNQQLLWHGTRMSNYVGILSQGLRIAPPEAPVTGYMFGKGVYLADCCSKSANYCHTSKDDPVGLMVLCQTALGTMLDKTANHYVTMLPTGYDSLRGLGTSYPDPKDTFATTNGVMVPYGKPIPNPAVPKSELLYNELIVYDVAQLMMKYVVKLRFNWNK